MKTRLSIDVPSGVVSRSFGGVAVPSALVGQVTARDIYEMEVVFTAGEGNYITKTVLPEGWVLKLGLRLNTSEGDALATSEPHTWTVVDGKDVANCIWNLNTDKVAALVETLPSTAKQTKVWFECEISLPDDENPLGPPKIRQSLILQQWMMLCEVNMEGDEPPAAAGQYAATAAAQAVIARQQAEEAARQVGLAAAKVQETADAGAAQVQLAAQQVGLAQQKVAAAAEQVGLASGEANRAKTEADRAAAAANAATGGMIPATEKGVAGGVATLGADGKVASSQLPTPSVNADQISDATAPGRTLLKAATKEAQKAALAISTSDVNGLAEALAAAGGNSSVPLIASGDIPGIGPVTLNSDGTVSAVTGQYEAFSAASVLNVGSPAFKACWHPTQNKLVLVGYSGGFKYAVGTVIGTTITFTAWAALPVTLSGATALTSNHMLVDIKYHAASDRFVIYFYGVNGSSQYVNFIQLFSLADTTVSSASTATVVFSFGWGWTDSYPGNLDVLGPVVVATFPYGYDDGEGSYNGPYPAVKAYTLTASTIAASGAQLTLSLERGTLNSKATICYDATASKWLVSYIGRDSGDTMNVLFGHVVSWSGTALSSLNSHRMVTCTWTINFGGMQAYIGSIWFWYFATNQGSFVVRTNITAANALSSISSKPDPSTTNEVAMTGYAYDPVTNIELIAYATQNYVISKDAGAWRVPTAGQAYSANSLGVKQLLPLPSINKVVLLYVDYGDGSKLKAQFFTPYKSSQAQRFAMATGPANNAAVAKVAIPGQVVGGLVGLTPKTLYYVAPDGALSTSSAAGPMIGYALSSTQLLVTHSNPGYP